MHLKYIVIYINVAAQMKCNKVNDQLMYRMPFKVKI